MTCAALWYRSHVPASTAHRGQRAAGEAVSRGAALLSSASSRHWQSQLDCPPMATGHPAVAQSGPIRPRAAAGGCSRLESWPSSLGPSSAAMSVSPAPCHGDRGRVQRQSVHATQSQCQMRPDGGARSTIECPASEGKCVTAPLKRLFAWP
jgi:hypothetical protein